LLSEKFMEENNSNIFPKKEKEDKSEAVHGIP
jgi:hypothetical protein